MASENAIYNKAAECLKVFNDCIESMTSTPWPQDQLDRFNLWAAHGGIFGSYQQHTSMDWRLRERPELVEMILQLLVLLHEYLSAICTLTGPIAGRAIAAVEDASRQIQSHSSHTSASTSSSECSFGLVPETSVVVADPIDTMRGKVEQTLSELFRISAAIRSAGMSYRHTKAANFVEWQDGVNLTQRFKEGVELLLRYKKPSPSDYMVKRLIETVCLRQRELAYSRRKRVGRSEKEESVKSHSVASLPPRSTAGYSRQGGSGSTTSKIARTAIGAFREKITQHDMVQSTVYTATYVPTMVFPQTKAVKTLMTRPQWSTIDDCVTNLPLPPEVGERLEFECPYCGIPLERAIFQGASWRNHVLEDLRPYVCILPDCKTPHALYKNSDSWISHMQTKHKVAKWKCVSSCQSKIRTFQTEAEFLTHAEHEHKEDFTTEEMLELANIGRYEINRELGVDILLECPICTISFEDKDFLAVYSHIAEDLTEYAWISLPESPHADANVSQKASSKSASVDDGRIGKRRESEIETERMFPWSLWDSDDLETRSDLTGYDADLKPVPDPSDADGVVLAEIQSDIRNTRRERLQQEPDPSQNLLREYNNEPTPDEGEDVGIISEGQPWYDEAFSSLLDPSFQSLADDLQNKPIEGKLSLGDTEDEAYEKIKRQKSLEKILQMKELQELAWPSAVEDRLATPPQVSNSEPIYISQKIMRGRKEIMILDKDVEVKEKSSVIYENRKSGYTVTAEKLLWIDGYEGSPLANESKISDREMTLVVLKIVLVSHNPNLEFSFMKASLRFEDTDYKQHQGLNEPQVEAWAPFHSEERWNALIPHGKTIEASIGFGFAGVSLSVGWEKTKSKIRDQTFFIEGRSNPEISPTTGRRNGITWVFEQNGLEKGGISQEICVAVLISRASSEPYLVRFQIDTRLGALEDLKNKTKQFFGLNPNKTKPFLVIPGKNVECNFEGNDIIETIDLKNLGRLRDQRNSSRLDLRWGSYYRMEISPPLQKTSETQEQREEKLPELEEISRRIFPKLSQFTSIYCDLVQNLIYNGPCRYRPTRIAIIDNGMLDISSDSENLRDPTTNRQQLYTYHPKDRHERFSRRPIDGTLWSRIKEGRSFVNDGHRTAQWFFASDLHGTQMAKIIGSIDPCCDLYVAKVSSERSEITPMRVAKAIRWAISKGVDVISMSFVLREGTEEVQNACRDAANCGIAMLCSAYDERKHLEHAYPAVFQDTISIMPCDKFTRVSFEHWFRSHDFIINGQDVLVALNPLLNFGEYLSESSVATAIAAGLSSLILSCNRLAQREENYEPGKQAMTVKHHLRKMAVSERKFVQPEKFAGIDHYINEGRDIDIEAILREVFSKDLD